MSRKRMSWSMAVLGSGLFASNLMAANVAVIDSGLDVNHPKLAEQVWINPADATYDQADNDNNGFVDDVYGWNFVNNNGILIDLKHSQLLNTDVRRFFELQGKSLAGSASEEEKAWMKAKITDKAFIKRLSTYGAFAHGTHVAGIVAQQSPLVKVSGIKLIPTENPLGSVRYQVEHALMEDQDINRILSVILKGGLILVAKAQAKALAPIGTYVGSLDMPVVNGSFGIGQTQAKMLLTPLLKLALRGAEPSTAQVDEFAHFFLQQLSREQAVLVRNAPESLFVFAAGNDGSDNDKFPTAPASIQHPHVMSVAAAFEDGHLAPFSNYGLSVDVAAPGVAVLSAAPNGERIALSGTSQAAPAVAGIAAAIKAENPDLGPQDLKKIIMATVDVKAELKGKVKSSGIVNRARALVAATLSRSQPLEGAIAEARKTVSDAVVKPLAPNGFRAMGTLINLEPAFLLN